MSYNQGFCARYASGGGHQAKRWISAIESIPAWHRRLMNVTILHRDIFDVTPKIVDEPGCVIYADPPYIKKGFRYVHDFSPEDHRRLATLLRRFVQTRVVVSYYEDPLLADLYPGWEIRRREVPRSLRSAHCRGTNKDRAVEVLLLNGAGAQPNLFSPRGA